MNQSTILFLFLKLYSFIWKLAIPFLKRNPRLRQGLSQRLSVSHLYPGDIWIQSASAGESYLTTTLIHQWFSPIETPSHDTQSNFLTPEALCPTPNSFLLTTTTTQGLEILMEGIPTPIKPFFVRPSQPIKKPTMGKKPSLQVAMFPFDIPDLMDRFMTRVKPKVIVLMETELWPGLLAAARKRQIPVIIINGRLSQKSFDRYMVTKALWRCIPPHRILSTSNRDAARFKMLFPSTPIQVMPNIKFDILTLQQPDKLNEAGQNTPATTPTPHQKKQETESQPSSHLFPNTGGNPLTNPISTNTEFMGKANGGETHGNPLTGPLSIFASVRQEEEDDLLSIIPKMLTRFPDQIILIFPRHMHRMDTWKQRLSTTAHNRWQLRSMLGTPAAVSPGTIILWDTFGELKTAYNMASVAFVGGSLKPLGGHNFIEPVMAGVPTVVGPHLEDFKWVGEDLFHLDMVKKVADKEGVLDFMLYHLNHPMDRKTVISGASLFIRKKQGGQGLPLKRLCRT